MYFQSLKELIGHHKDYIVQELFRRLGQLRSPYQDFICRTEEGQRRLNIWIILIIRALEGDCDAFHMDQKNVGYARASQGFYLEDVLPNIEFLQQIFWEILEEALTQQKLRSVNLIREIRDLMELIFDDIRLVAISYVKTREEQINEKVTHLKELYDFTREIIITRKRGEIVNLILNKMTLFLGVEKSYLALSRDRYVQAIYPTPTRQVAHEIRHITEEAFRQRTSLFLDERGDIYEEIDQSDLKRGASVPIQAHGRCYGVLTLFNSTIGFKFTKKELHLLNQFLYITAAALENLFMVEEIEQNRKELRFLSTRMINIQEEERRHLAADIHDTLAQSLSGISYKIQFCKELSNKTPELLMEQFDSLINTVNDTIDKSREIISSLRPDLIDTMGLVPALKLHIDNFEQETGISVNVHLPKQIKMPSEVEICLFRVTQEALMNVYKHAETNAVEVILQKEGGNFIFIVADNGKGFDMSRAVPWIKDQNKFGLLSMKERVEAAGGKLVINTGINQGCRIEANVPINVEVSHNADD